MTNLSCVAFHLCLLTVSVQAFVAGPTTPTTTRQHSALMLEARTRPVVVVGKVMIDVDQPTSVGGSAAAATLGAALALSARDILQGTCMPSADKTPPPAQPVMLLSAVDNPDVSADLLQEMLQDVLRQHPTLVPRTNKNEYPSISDYERVLQNEPILHIVMEGGAAAPSLLEPQIQNVISYLGIEPVVPRQMKDVVSADIAQRCGTVLQQILDHTTKQEDIDAPVAAISLDLPLHLSMLQANCLPKSTAHGDSYYVIGTGSDTGARGSSSIVVDYLYDYDNPFGGTDPLSCPTKEVVIPTSAVDSSLSNNEMPWTKEAGHASAAACTVLRGNGMDAVMSACIAASVGTIFCEHSSCYPPPYGWPVIERIAQLSEQVFENAVEEQVMRKTYIEFGYK